MVAEQIRREEDHAVSTGNQAGHDSDSGLPDDADDLEDPVEFEAWRLREVQRLARDRKERHAFEHDKAETERRRGLTEGERAAEDLAAGKGAKEGEKEKWKFMQKYYHKGAFYMDEEKDLKDADDVRKRTFAEPTLEDKFDKSSMPKVMQVKKFGFASQTKYTHLKDQDTTDYDSAWMMDTGKRKHFDTKLSGLGDIDAAGRKRPKKP
jgi:microfibrillar-associated protein 1